LEGVQTMSDLDDMEIRDYDESILCPKCQEECPPIISITFENQYCENCGFILVHGTYSRVSK